MTDTAEVIAAAHPVGIEMQIGENYPEDDDEDDAEDDDDEDSED